MKTYSLIDVLSKEIIIEDGENEKIVKFSGIKIPIIQRDYAHGREKEIAVRTRFLNHIFKALTENELLELDFIYGSVKGYVVDKNSRLEKIENFFIPLDGQQRLTTLFLLYWYVGNRELVGDELNNLRKKLILFSYATRSTSASFCHKLCEINMVVDPAGAIKKSFWFHDSFKQDPTVRSMLLMIEQIDIYYKNINNIKLFPNLENLRFYILPLDGFDLSDELYIKMNGRGKQLTGFENFKADLVNWMNDEANEKFHSFQRRVEYNNHLIPYYLQISSKIDNEWTNVFWKDAKEEVEVGNRVVDPAFMRFLMRSFITRFMAKSKLNLNQIENSTFFTKLIGAAEYQYEGLEPFEQILQSIFQIQDLEQIMDRYAASAEAINQSLSPPWPQDSKWEMTNIGVTQRQYTLFYAVITFLEHNHFIEESFRSWMRVIWNIIVDPELRRNSTMINFVRLIDRLSLGSGDIITYLTSEEFKESFVVELKQNGLFNTGQIFEEHIKATLIDKDRRFLKELNIAESHPRFKGKIFFLIQDLELTSLDNFIRDRDIAIQLFERTDLRVADRWIRAVLACNTPLNRYLQHSSLSLGDDNLENWRNLINNQLKSGMVNLIHGYDASLDLREYFDSVIENFQLTDDNLWLYNIITWEKKEMSLLDYSETKKIVKYAFWDDVNTDRNRVYLYNKTIWTDNNILLSNFRNQIIKELLEDNKARHLWQFGNIQRSYFRGKFIDCVRNIGDMKLTYRFEFNTLKVGVLVDSSNIDDIWSEPLEEFKEKYWIFRKCYKFDKITDINKIKDFLESVEWDFFNESNSNSILNLIRGPLSVRQKDSDQYLTKTEDKNGAD